MPENCRNFTRSGRSPPSALLAGAVGSGRGEAGRLEAATGLLGDALRCDRMLGQPAHRMTTLRKVRTGCVPGRGRRGPGSAPSPLAAGRPTWQSSGPQIRKFARQTGLREGEGRGPSRCRVFLLVPSLNMEPTCRGVHTRSPGRPDSPKIDLKFAFCGLFPGPGGPQRYPNSLCTGSCA